MPTISRRQLLRAGFTSGVVSSIGFHNLQAVAGGVATPSEIEGPFYPVREQKDKDFDLTVVDGAADEALGSRIFIQGLVVDVNDQPIEDATVDLWQANAAGRYAHPRDSNPAPVDPNFQGWAIVPSGTEGEFRFKTIMPGAYPAAQNWRRPPHIHFRIQKLGYEQLTTQMYFPGHELNNSDLLIARKQPREREAMIAEQIGNDVGITTFRYKIVLASS